MKPVYRREQYALGRLASLQAARPTTVIAQIKKIMANSATTHLSDIWHRALVVLLFHSFPKAHDEFALETAGYRFLHRIAFVDEEIEQRVGYIIRET